jgi:hypothetical protein
MLIRLARSFQLIRSTTTTTKITTPITTQTTEINEYYDQKEFIDMYNSIILADESLSTKQHVIFVLLLSICGIILNVLTFLICILMLRSLLNTNENTTRTQSIEVSTEPLTNNNTVNLTKLSKSAGLQTLKVSIPKPKGNKFNKKRIIGKSRLMECYLLEIILFDFIKVLYVFAHNFYHYYNRHYYNNLSSHESLEDISNFSCKALMYIQKVASLMSCWLIVCFSLNRLCLLINKRSEYSPFLIKFRDDDHVSQNEEIQMAHQSTYSSCKTSILRPLNSSSRTVIAQNTMTRRRFSLNRNTFDNFNLVINSKKSTLILFFVFVLINIYFIEITSLVDGDVPIFSSFNQTERKNFTTQHVSKQVCASNVLDNKSVMILNITIHQIFGFFIPYLISIFTIYYLIKNLYKIKHKINKTIKLKSQSFQILSNELIFYRSALTAIVLSIFYLVTTFPYSVCDIIRILRPSKTIIDLLAILDHIRRLNFSLKFL